MAKTSSEPFDNNPFTLAVNGLTTLFNTAREIFFLFLVLSVAQFYSSPNTSEKELKEQVDSVGQVITGWSATEWTLAAGTAIIIALAVAMITALFGGVSSYTSAQLAKGKQVSISEAFRVAFENLWSYLWLQILITIKLFLWTLLFIIPGIIMSVRYSLAGVAFFDDDKHLRGNAAIKESIKLTKNAWMTTFGSFALFNLITLGIIGRVINIGVAATLYRQYQAVGDKKPKTHPLSWITLALPFIMAILLFIFIVFVYVFVESFWLLLPS